MGIFDEFIELVADIASDTVKLGKDLSEIAVETVEEFIDDPIEFTTESVKEISQVAVGIVTIPIKLKNGVKSTFGFYNTFSHSHVGAYERGKWQNIYGIGRLSGQGLSLNSMGSGFFKLRIFLPLEK